MERMVVGYVFDEGFYHVVLIKKSRPDWCRGLLNGVGGHIEEGETPVEAMRREFKEEAGVDIADWKEICKMEGENWSVDVFGAQHRSIYNIKTQTDEEIKIQELFYMCYVGNTVPNAKWLIEMCQENMTNPNTFKTATIKY